MPTENGRDWVDEVRMTENGLPRLGATVEEQILKFYMSSAWNLIKHIQDGEVAVPDESIKLLRLTLEQVPNE